MNSSVKNQLMRLLTVLLLISVFLDESHSQPYILQPYTVRSRGESLELLNVEECGGNSADTGNVLHFEGTTEENQPTTYLIRSEHMRDCNDTFSFEIKSKEKSAEDHTFDGFPPWDQFVQILADKVSRFLQPKGAEEAIHLENPVNQSEQSVHFEGRRAESPKTIGKGDGLVCEGGSQTSNYHDWMGPERAGFGGERGLRVYQQKTNESEFIMEAPVEEEPAPKWGPGMFQGQSSNSPDNPAAPPEPPLPDWWKVVTMRPLQHTQKVKYIGRWEDECSRLNGLESEEAGAGGRGWEAWRPIEGYLLKSHPGRRIEDLLVRLQGAPQEALDSASVESPRDLPKTAGFGSKIDTPAKKNARINLKQDFK